MSDAKTMRNWLDNSIDLIEAGCAAALFRMGMTPKTALLDFDEIVNEVYIKLAANPPTEFTNWAGLVYTRSYWRAMRAVRFVTGYTTRDSSDNRRMSPMADIDTEYGDEVDGDQEAIDLSDSLGWAMGKLKEVYPRCHHVLQLRHYEGLSSQEIADTLKVDVSRVSQLSTQGLGELRKFLVESEELEAA